MGAMATLMTGVPIFAQLLVHLQIKENIKARSHGSLYREFTCDRWIPRTKSQ